MLHKLSSEQRVAAPKSRIAMKALTFVRIAPILMIFIMTAIAGAAFAQQQIAPRTDKPAAPRPSPAQSAQSQASPPAVVPQSTTATYADWIVQCQIQAGPPAEKICDMAQVTQVQGRNIPFSRVAVAHPTKGQPIKLAVQVPVNVSIATNVRIQISDSDPGVAAPFARCIPAGCFADFEIRDDNLKKFTSVSGVGKLSFADGNGHELVVPLSFNGFKQAFDALEKE